MLTAYRRWRHTRFVRRWRPYFEERRYWDRFIKTAVLGLDDTETGRELITHLRHHMWEGRP